MGRNDLSHIKKAEILECAYEAIKDHGVEGATLSKIAEYMEGHKSLLTYYFKTKEELLISLVDSIIGKYEKFFYDAISDITDMKKCYETTIDILFSRQWNTVIDFKVFCSCFYLSLYNKKIKHSFKKMYGRFIDYLAISLNVYMDEGIIKKGDAEKLAMYIISLVEGLDILLITMEEKINIEEYSCFLKQKVMKELK